MLLNLQETDGPLHRRICDSLKTAIRSGRLEPGARLPSTRGLATDLAVSRNTVALAYEQLVAEGYVVARARSKMAVAEGSPAPARPARPSARSLERPRLSAYGQRIVADPGPPPAASYARRPGVRWDFRYGRPVVDEFPREVWRQLISQRTKRATLDTYGYAAPEGYRPLREALTGYLWRARGIACDADQIVIVNGSQQAFDLVTRVLLDPGDGVVIEEPHYHGSRMVFESAGARCTAVPVDAYGLDTARLPAVETDIRLACVTPCYQFPTGVVMPMGRRLALLDWARRSGSWIVEDDYVSEFRYQGRPIEALQSLDTAGRVIYIGTFSKTLFPALRLAYLVLPPALVGPVVTAKWLADRYSAMLGQEALTDFITSGRFERYLRRACALNASRRQALVEALRQHLGERIEIAGENAGVHMLVWLNDVARSAVGGLIARAAAAGVGLYPIDAYFSRPPQRAGLLFGYASLTEREIRAGVKRFAQVMEGK